MTELTQRQANVLDTIVAHFHRVGVYPTTRDLAAAMGIESTNGIYDHLRALNRKGFVALSGGRGKHAGYLIVRRTSDGVAVRARVVPEFGESPSDAEQTATIPIPVYRSLSHMRAGASQ